MTRVATLVLVGLAAVSVTSAQSPGAEKRAAFLKIVERPRVELRPEVRPLGSSGEPIVVEHISFAVEGADRVTGLLVKSATAAGRRPAVIQLHGTGGNKEQLRPRLALLASRGFVAIAIDGRYHGERATKTVELGTPYTTAIFNAYKTGGEHPFFYDTTFDVIRLIDYLETRADVDATRIGLGGFSKGGIETYLTAAVEPRVAAAVAGHGVQSFGWALDHSAWDSRAWTIRDAIEASADETKTTVNATFVKRFYDRVAPGIYSDFDAPAMLPLVAPRPLLVINGDSDPRTPIAGVWLSAASAEQAYKAAGVPEKFALKVLPSVGHEQTPAYEQAMVEWFVTWLKP